MSDNHSTSEVGHAKNVAQLSVMIDALELLELYNPINPKITIIDLRKKYTEYDDLIGIVNQKESINNDVINQRQYAYKDLGPYTTRLYNSASVISEDPKLMEDMRTVVNKIQGELAMPQTNEDEEGQEIKEPRSSSQQSFDYLAANFKKLVEYLERIPGYLPNEEDLTIPVVKAYLADLIMHNKNASKSLKALQKARLNRDKALYNEEEGLYYRQLTVKKYVRSVYGADSPESEQISGIEFKDQDSD